MSWRKMPIGAIITGGATSLVNKTGSWRTMRPVIMYDKCTDCGICWLYCPDSAINRTEKGTYEIDYEYCKGCQICAAECRVGAIETVAEEYKGD